MTDTATVASHYGWGNLLDRISAGMAARGLPQIGLAPEALAPVDELHTGGLPATIRLFDQLDVPEGARILDIGCGLGGPARAMAARTAARGTHVTGIDLTPDFVDTGNVLSQWCGLSDRVTLLAGDALALPFDAASFDLAYMLHVGMNIADKPALFAGIARVLKPGATFAVYDLMQIRPGAIAFPVPWASRPEFSVLADPAAYRAALAAAGFRLLAEADQTAGAIAFFDEIAAKTAAADGPPPLGVHLIMGERAPEYSRNVVQNIRDGLLAPVEMIARLEDPAA